LRGSDACRYFVRQTLSVDRGACGFA